MRSNRSILRSDGFLQGECKLPRLRAAARSLTVLVRQSSRLLAFPRRPAVQVTVISVSFTIALMASSFAATADEEHWRDVKGAALRSLFKDKEFGDGVHFAYQFRSDGTFTGTEMAKEVSGSWRVRQNELCWNWLRPPGPRECYEVQQNGTHVRLLINGSEAWYGTLEKLR